jgi:hypothetical protein
MRALLLILIGGGLIWVLIQGLGPSLAKNPEGEPSNGTMLAEEGARSAAPAQAEAEEQEAPAPAVPAAEPKAEPAPAAVPVPEPAKRASPEPAPAEARAGEVEIAARLVHQPEGFGEWLEARKESLPPGRREFARALALQLAGSTEEAGRLVRSLSSAGDLADDERKLLDFWPQGPSFAMPEPGAARGSLLLRAAGLASVEHSASEALAAGRSAEAADGYSRLLLAEVGSPWESDARSMGAWTEGLARAQSGYRWHRKGSWSALELKVASGDSLIGLRKRALQERPDLITCTGLIARANQLQGETIQPGQTLRVPTGKPHVLVDLSARWLFFLIDDEVVAAWPVGVGKPGSQTPPGSYRVGEKSTDPTWFRSGQAPVPAGDPRNPLGTRWIAWMAADGEKTHLGFHGTRDPESVGQDESEGCVRMLNRHVEELYEILPRSSEILVQP